MDHIQKMDFRNRVHNDYYSARYWTTSHNFPIATGSVLLTQLQSLLDESFKHDTLFEHRAHTKYEVPLDETTKIHGEKFGAWADVMFNNAITIVVGKQRAHTVQALQTEVLRIFENALHEVVRLAKLKALNDSSSFHEKLEAGYFDTEKGAKEFQHELFHSLGLAATEKVKRIYNKASELANGSGRAQLVSEFEELVALL